MITQLKKELNILKDKLISLSAIVESNIDNSIIAFLNKDKDLAKQVIESDDAIHVREVEFEEDCLKIIALYQPVASDLRMVIAYLKINNDLERIGKLSVNIARKADYLSKNKKIDFTLDYSNFIKISQSMLKNSILALIEMDDKIANQVLTDDQKVSKVKKKFRDVIITNIKENPNKIDILLRHHAFIRHLERIADMATNIAEDILYMVTGNIRSKRLEQDYMEDNEQ